MKICTVCKEEKPLAEFYRRTASKDGAGYRCKPCDTATRATSRNGPGGEGTRRRLRERKLVAKYGLTLEQYDAMLEAQGGCCAICGTDNPYGEGQAEKRMRMSFAVDHNHLTNTVRGLLCNLCNRALGFLQDNPEVVRAAYDYLKRH